MAQVSSEHIQPLTVGWVTLLVVSLLALAALNRYADK